MIIAPLPKIGEPFRALRVYHQILKLEKQGNFEKAREVRMTALSSINPKYQGPILRTEGLDKLYRLKDYQGAFEAFELAEVALDKSASLYGVSQPDSILAGAAQAAIFLGNKMKAIEYRDKFLELLNGLKKVRKTNKPFTWHEETLDWINKEINRWD